MFQLHSRRRRTLPAKTGSRPIGRWLRLERLEDRSVPAVITWDIGPWSGHDLNWLNPANWSGGVLPGPNDDAVITNNHGLMNNLVTLAGNASVHSVSFQYSALSITTGALTIGSGQSKFGTGLLLNGGTLIPLDGASMSGGDIVGNQSVDDSRRNHRRHG